MKLIIGPIVLLAVALVSFAASVRIARGVPHEAIAVAPAQVSQASKKARFPSPAQFERDFVSATNRFADEHGDPARIGRARCVQASPGRYMCSYAVTKPGAPRECHLMQARWTPRAASTITVTLAGRTGRCGTLREAIRSLR